MVIRKTIEELQGRSTGFPIETRSTMHPKWVEKEIEGCMVESDLRVEDEILEEKNGVGRKDKLTLRRECSTRECKKSQVHFIQVSTFENTTEYY